eukprot:CAMPEP_0180638508 /NCGR_PEP_ID=MMETSP1037_2-20121125/44379_1 /TAXON_ID=632150 /ORGANISM="Azadinium spinosum, Strain 3D9" /LENGTH=113 /DNA_ID=CAMNT_0022660075 /DNA_START=451 /DNA_END=789 /DNA_ORIENTATION=-
MAVGSCRRKALSAARQQIPIEASRRNRTSNVDTITLAVPDDVNCADLVQGRCLLAKQKTVLKTHDLGGALTHATARSEEYDTDDNHGGHRKCSAHRPATTCAPHPCSSLGLIA